MNRLGSVPARLGYTAVAKHSSPDPGGTSMNSREQRPTIIPGPDGPQSRVGIWSGIPAIPALPEHDQLRAMHWSKRALGEAWGRCGNNTGDAFRSWTAAVEGVWWALALDEVLTTHMGPAPGNAYKAARGQDPYGKIVDGMTWLRHRHAHEMIVAGAGGPKKDFFGKPQDGYVFFISPSNRWKKSGDVRADHDRRPDLRPAYDEHVAGLPLADSLYQCGIWFDRVFSACGFSGQDVKEGDPTIL